MERICDDLDAEYRSLRGLVATLEPDAWSADTPAAGWTIQDSIGHLAFFDEQAVLAYRDPQAFTEHLAGVGEDLASFESDHLAQIRALGPGEVLAWWAGAHAELTSTYRAADPKERVAWYGPPMAARSKITARLMETWAHGQDIADALSVERVPTDRLRHICHLGVRARPYSYMVNQLPAPDVEVFVALSGPGGEQWAWGDPDASARIVGSALDFALVAVQRRHLDDTELVAIGVAAAEWLSIIQAFAGPPGPGRQPL